MTIDIDSDHIALIVHTHNTSLSFNFDEVSVGISTSCRLGLVADQSSVLLLSIAKNLGGKLHLIL